MAKEIKLTQESLDAYKEELEYLKTTRADEVAESILAICSHKIRRII